MPRNWLSNWFFKTAQKKRLARSTTAKLAVTTLEDRTVLSTYFVIGSGSDDSILVSGTPSSLTITNNGTSNIVARPSTSQAQNVVSIPSGTSYTYVPAAINRDPVSELTIRGNDGDDTIDASGLTGGLGVTIEGGDGDDTVIGSRYDDVLEGGNGKDKIYGEGAVVTPGGPETVDVGLASVDGPKLWVYNDSTNQYSQVGSGSVVETSTTVSSPDVLFSGINVTGAGEVPAKLKIDSGESFGIEASNTGSNPNKRINGTEIFRAELRGEKVAQTAVVTINRAEVGSTYTIKAYLKGTEVGTTTGSAAQNTPVTVNFGLSVVFDRLDISGGNQGFSVRNVGFGNLYAGVGNDEIDGGSGVDELFGGYGDDTFIANFGDLTNDTIDGGFGHDAIKLNPGRNQSDPIVLASFTPSNSIEALRGGSRVRGTDADNKLDFSAVTEWTTGRRIEGQNGNDTIIAPNGVGGFAIDGGTENDIIYGSDGNDVIDGGAGDDEIYGMAGDDMISPGSGVDKADGGDGDDTFLYGGGDNSTNDELDGGTGINTLFNEANNQRTLSSFGPLNNIQVLAGKSRIDGTDDANVFDFSGVTTWTGMKEVRAGNGDDTVTTSTVHNGQFYRGGNDTDTINLVFTPAQWDAIVTAGKAADVAAYAASPTGKTLDLSSVPGVNVKADTFENATLAFSQTADYTVNSPFGLNTGVDYKIALDSTGLLLQVFAENDGSTAGDRGFQGIGTNVLTVPLVGINSLTINASNREHDSFTIFGNAVPTVLNLNGLNGDHTDVIFTGGSFADFTVKANTTGLNGQNSGVITVDGKTVNFTNGRYVRNTSDTVNTTFTAKAGSDTFSVSGTANGVQVGISGLDVYLKAPTGLLTIDGAGGSDEITLSGSINNLGSADLKLIGESLNVAGGAVVNVGGDLYLFGDTFDLGRNGGQVNVTGNATIKVDYVNIKGKLDVEGKLTATDPVGGANTFQLSSGVVSITGAATFDGYVLTGFGTNPALYSCFMGGVTIII